MKAAAHLQGPGLTPESLELATPRGGPGAMGFGPTRLPLGGAAGCADNTTSPEAALEDDLENAFGRISPTDRCRISSAARNMIRQDRKSSPVRPWAIHGS